MIIKKVLKSFLDPFTLPHKINFHSRKLFHKIYYQSRYDFNKFHNYQIDSFDKYGINHEKALEKLKKIRSEHEELELQKNLAHSEHQTFFSGLSEVNKNIKRILEIGTFNAQNAYLLSVLFQNAQVTTVDLPNDSDDYKNTYKRDEKTKLKAFWKKEVTE